MDECLSRRDAVVITEQATRLPKVRIDRTVARVEQLRHRAEVVVLTIVERAIHLAGRYRHLRMPQGGCHPGGGQHAGGQRQMDARREEGVDETGSITDENITLARDPV